MASRLRTMLGGTAILALALTGCDDTPDDTASSTTGTDADGTAGAPDAEDADAEDTGAAAPQEADEEPQPIIEAVTEGLDQPWGLAFLDGGPLLLVTQLPGTLSVVDTDTGEVTDLAGVPEVVVEGQGGLLDVAVDPDDDWIYLTHVSADDGATSTHLSRARLDLDAARLDDVEVLFAVDPFLPEPPVHFGSRVVVGPDEHLYVTVGDRGSKDFDDHPSQDPSNHLGTTIRLAPDGSVPQDNPFVDDPDVRDEIFTFGHRNVQGMAVHPDTGKLWQSEHGEEDGDELNVLRAGGNYGWPVATTACEYGTDVPVGEHPDERDDTVPPVRYWECGTGGFAPGGMTFYDGDQFPAWQGDLFVAGLATQELARFAVDGDTAEEVERLLGDEGWRIRDVEAGPHDGALYLALDEAEVPIVRLVAEDGG